MQRHVASNVDLGILILVCFWFGSNWFASRNVDALKAAARSELELELGQA